MSAASTGWFWEKIRPKRSKSPLVVSIPGRKMPVCWSRAGTCAPAFPKETTLQAEEILEALKRPARQIVDEIFTVLERTPPELVADLAQNGIVLTGGGSLIWGMEQLIRERTELPCILADDADSCVAYGCGKSLAWINHMQEGTINLARRRLMQA